MANIFDSLGNKIKKQLETNLDQVYPIFGGSLGPAETNPFTPDPVTDFTKTYSSYSGTDVTIIAQVNNKLIVLGNVETFSYSIFREKSPVRVLGRSYAKGYTSGCVKFDELIFTKTGYKQIKDINIGDDILSFNEKTQELVYNKCLNKIYSGIKKVFKILLIDGSEMYLTENHKVFTNNDWKDVKYLDVNDELIVPINYDISVSSINVSDNYLKLLAFGIGDGVFGSYKNGKETRFVLTPGIKDIEILKEIEKICEQENLLFSKVFKNNCYQIVIKNTKKSTWFQNREYHDFILWTKTLGIYGKYSHTKYIPEQLFNLSNEQLAIFLSRLFGTNGCITNHSDNTYRIEYDSTSHKLIYQIKLLLKRFGIHCRIKNTGKHSSKLIVGKHDAYRLIIDGNYVYKFLDKIGIIGKNLNKNELEKLEKTLLYDINDIKKIKKSLKIASKSFPWCNGRNKKRLGNLGFSYEYLKENNIFPCIYKEQFKSIKIDKIIDAEEVDTYDLEIEKDHNLFGSFLSHNSRSIAGSIVFALFDKSPLYDIVKELNYIRNPNDRKSSPMPDQLPPIDFILLFQNEYGHKSIMRLYGVEFMQEGQVHSIQDLYSENTMQYVARDMDQLTAFQDIAEFKDMMFERQVRGLFIDNNLSTMLDYKKRIEQQLADTNNIIQLIDTETGKRAIAGVFTFGATAVIAKYLSPSLSGKTAVTRDDLNKEKEKQLKIKTFLLRELDKINNQIRLYEQNMAGWNSQNSDYGVTGRVNMAATPPSSI